MLIIVAQEQGRVPVTVIRLHGDLDSTNYTEVIEKAQEIHDGGARHLILELSKVPFIGSAALMSLHTVALIFAGQKMHKDASGRPAFRALDPDRDQMARDHVKLVNPQPRVAQVLETVGLKRFFEIFGDVQSAVDSF